MIALLMTALTVASAAEWYHGYGYGKSHLYFIIVKKLSSLQRLLRTTSAISQI